MFRSAQIDPRTGLGLGDVNDDKSPALKRTNSDPSPRPGSNESIRQAMNISTLSVRNGRSAFATDLIQVKGLGGYEPPSPLPNSALVRPSSSRSKSSIKKRLAKPNMDNREMDWFAFENRVREIIKDILEPYAIKSIDVQENIKVLSDNYDKFKRKQDEMEFVMHKRNHRNSGIDELNKKLFDIENERKVREARNMQQIENLKVQLEATQDRMTQIEELSLTFKKQADDIKHEINGFFDQLTKFQEKFSKDQLKYKEDMNKNFLTLRNQYLKTEELSKVNKNYINNHFEELKRHDMIVQSYQKNFNELYKKIQFMDKNKIDIVQFNDEFTKLKKDINHVRFLNEDVFQSVQLIDSYINLNVPMEIEKKLKVSSQFISA